MIWVLVFVLTFLLAATVCLMIGQAESHKRALAEHHAKSMAMVAGFVGNQFAASVLEATAEHYGSMDGQAEQRRIANTMYSPGGPSVPEMYLRERATSVRQGWES